MNERLIIALKMHGIRVSIVAFVEYSFPDWVRVVFTDVHGREWSIVEKTPIVTAEFLDENSRYPIAGFAVGTIIIRFVAGDKRVVTIDLSQPWGISTEDGQEVFDVFEEQIIEA